MAGDPGQDSSMVHIREETQSIKCDVCCEHVPIPRLARRNQLERLSFIQEWSAKHKNCRAAVNPGKETRPTPNEHWAAAFKGFV